MLKLQLVPRPVGSCRPLHKAGQAVPVTCSYAPPGSPRKGQTSALACPTLHRLQRTVQTAPKELSRRAAQGTEELSNQLSSAVLDCADRTHGQAPASQSDAGTSHPWTRLMDVRKWSPRGRGLAMLNGLVLLCASNWVVLKSSNDVFDPYTFSLLRFSVAALAFWPFLKRADKGIWQAGLELGLWSGLGYLLQAEGILTTDASRASFLSAFTVIVVPLLSGLSGKGVSPVTWLSALVAFGGMGLLEQGGAPAGMGDLWNLLSALFFGIQVFRTEHHSRKLGPEASLALMAVVLLTIMSMAAGAALATHPGQLQNLVRHPTLMRAALHTLSLKQLLPVFWTGLCSTDAVLLIEVLALQDVPSTDAAIIYTLEPVAGAALAWGFLGERWSAAGWVGALMIVGSSLAAQLLSKGGSKESTDMQT